MKTRSDCKLAPHEDFIFQRLVDGNESYQTVADELQKLLGVRTSASALSEYFSRHSWRWRAERAAAQATSIEKALKVADFSDAKAKAIAQREFELAASNLSVQELARLKKIGQIDRKLNLDERSIELREFDAAKAALQHAAAIKSIATSKSLNDTEKVDAVRRRLFGEIPEEVNG
jgi:vacuolar-type H+-ATPase subunit I/STV1